MKTLSFELTMPNVGSWNGEWTGSHKKYFIIRKVTAGLFKEKIKPLLNEMPHKNFYYNFGDGWGANVKMEIINSCEGNNRRKISSGFCGYDWMVDSIMANGKIIC